MSSVREQASQRLLKALSELGNEEVLVLDRLAQRILLGQKQYGKLDLANDTRDFAHERAMESLDRIIYDCIIDVANDIKKAAG